MTIHLKFNMIKMGINCVKQRKKKNLKIQRIEIKKNSTLVKGIGGSPFGNRKGNKRI